ncbi:ribonucleases P/MRP protein subunit POP1-domain-containing protein [Dipodascopsis tothii]|uniref:ribonucleases P/MRP protein subunit POP1-domain-containing protein n=1 Tax=Dipodascopsis tothii TaxID=44089 RepID=UPI0034CE40B3
MSHRPGGHTGGAAVGAPRASDQAAASRAAGSRKRKSENAAPDRPSKGPRTAGSGGQHRPARTARRLDARYIATQSSETALKDGQLDVGHYVAARAFETQQMLRALKAGRDNQKQQAFQAVPRSLRRRAASHHLKRLPARFLARALEQENARRRNGEETRVKPRQRVTKLTQRKQTAYRLRLYAERRAAKRTRPDTTNALVVTARRMYLPVGVNERAVYVVRDRKFRARQRDKIWLPTHLWNAKRAHLSTHWGYSVVDHPNEKCFRPTHRTQAHTRNRNENAVVFDTTYVANLVLAGPAAACALVVNQLSGGAAGRGAYTPGTRVFEGSALAANGGLLGPLTVFWQPERLLEDAGTRQVLVRVHAAMFDDVWDRLMELAGPADVTVHDCRFALGSIELFGPDPEAALRKAVAMAPELAADGPAHLHIGMAWQYMFYDPRTYPSVSWRRPKARSGGGSLQTQPLDDAGREAIAARTASVFSARGRSVRPVRQAAAASLVGRRFGGRPDATAAVAGANGTTYYADDVLVPGLVYRQRSGGLTMVLPWQWVRHFYSRLAVGGQNMFGGLNQYRQIMAERGRAYFPDDFPATPAGAAANAEQTAARRLYWERRPPSKRTNYERVRLAAADGEGELGDPFACDWSLLRGSVDDEDKVQVEALASGTRGVHDGLLTVQLVVISRGAPGPAARVYAIPPDAHEQWMALQRDRKIVPGRAEYPPCPSKEYLVGFATTAGFNLQNGQGGATASVLYARARRLRMLGDRYCIVRDSGETYGRLAVVKTCE